MMTTVVIRDESMSGQPLGELTVEIPGEKITVRELIRSRVFQDVKESHARDASREIEAKPLVQPSSAEVSLNGPRSVARSSVDWQAQFSKALDAFRAHQIMILVDGQQVASLDENIEIHSASKISFLRLTMLMGG